jgi:predicted dehydrogenase
MILLSKIFPIGKGMIFMFRIGLIGSDNSHGLGFAKYINFPCEKSGKHRYDARITAVYGHDAGENKKTAEEGNIEKIYENPADMMGNVDAGMVIFRHGSKHAKYALPFIEAGIPTWVDKPFTSDIKEAEMLAEAAEKSGTILSGGSNCIYSRDIETLSHITENDKGLGKILSGYLNFPGEIESQYDGIFFYGCHSVEMMLKIFGNEVKSVISTVVNGKLVVTVRYPSFHVVLNFVAGCPGYFAIVYGENKAVVREIDMTDTLRLAFEDFYRALQTKTQPCKSCDLVLPVRILSAIDRSIKEGKEINI